MAIIIIIIIMASIINVIPKVGGSLTSLTLDRLHHLDRLETNLVKDKIKIHLFPPPPRQVRF